MRRLSSRLIAIIFILIIFGFGSLTVWRSKGAVIKVLKSSSFTECADDIEAVMTDKFARKNDWINLNGLFQRSMGITIVRDSGDIDVYKLSNGQLTYAYPDKGAEMSYDAGNVVALRDYVENSGSAFMYVQLPCKVYSDGLMPPGTESYANVNSDQILSCLRDAGVKTLDIRQSIAEEGLNVPELFFNTDHHWKPATALWAAGIISNELSGSVSGYTYDRSIYDISNYSVKTYNNWFLGSLGRRTGKYFGGTDDFDVIIPKFETSFELYTESQTSGKPKHRDGTFEEALLKLSNIEKKNLFSEKTYFTYTGSEYRTSITTNRKAPNDCKILLIRDSFSCTLMPFLALSNASVTAVDLRYHDGLEIRSMIDDGNYDAVIIAYNPSMFREDGAFDFFG